MSLVVSPNSLPTMPSQAESNNSADKVDDVQETETIDACDWRQIAYDSKVIVGQPGQLVTIGRSSNSMLQIGHKSTSISRIHAEIRSCDSTEQYELFVLGMNGVRVNDKLYHKEDKVQLCTGDEINFVGIRFKFKAATTTSTQIECGQETVEEWVPEPVSLVSRKRKLGAPMTVASKRMQQASEQNVEFNGSTDTLIGGGSDAGLQLSSEWHNVFNPPRKTLDDLPPSSPPATPLMMLLEDVPSFPDNLPRLDSISSEPPIDLLSVTPPPFPQQQPSVPALAPKQQRQKLKQASNPAKPKKPKATNNSVADKENNGKSAVGAHIKRGKKDDEMMASLRELLGVVDPSECLADRIDSDTEEFLTTQPSQDIKLPQGANSLADLLVQTMVFSARTSHTVSDLLRDMAQIGSDNERAWRHHLTWTLFNTPCFGHVERRVKDASDKRAEDKWYYDASRDDCIERRENFGGLVRTARRCTLRDTQYYFKQVPKLQPFRYR